ncbi:hypothetical protein Slin14017_G035010 [Septoria linicola]|nr:hypothetical protein Slin14017_G035010 [Septoria linicola]
MAGVVLLQALLTDNKVHSRFSRMFWPLWTGITVVLSLVAFIYSFVETYTSTTMDVRGSFAAGLRPRPESVFEERLETPFDSTGTYNVEAYSCRVREILVTGRNWGLNPCVKMMTARWLTLPLFIVAIVLCTMSIWYPPTPSRKAAPSTTEMRITDAADRGASRHDSEASRASVKTETAA